METNFALFGMIRYTYRALKIRALKTDPLGG